MAESRSRVHRLAAGSSLLSVAEAFRVGVAVLMAVYFARRLGAAAFGILTFAMAVSGVSLAFVDAGLTWLGTREAARNPTSVPALVRAIVSIRTCLACIGLLAVGGFLVLADVPAGTRVVVLLTQASLFTAALSLDWVFYGIDRSSHLAIATLARTMVQAGLVFAIVDRPDRLWMVPLCQVGGELAGAAFLWRTLTRLVHQPGPGSAPPVRWVLAQAAPLAGSQFMRAVTAWSSATVIALWAAPAVVGQFGAAQRLSQAAAGFTVLYFYGYLALASRAIAEGPGALDDLARRSIRLTAVLTLPFAVGTTLLAPSIVRLVFGPSYMAAAGVLRLLVWTVPISVLGGHFRHTLIAARRTMLDCAAVSAGAAVTVGLNLLLVPQWGLTGAAVSFVAGEATLMVVAALLAWSYGHGVGTLLPLARIAVPTAAMGVAIGSIRSYGWPLAALAGIATYGCALLLMQEVRLADLIQFRRTLVGRGGPQ